LIELRTATALFILRIFRFLKILTQYDAAGSRDKRGRYPNHPPIDS
jgi:hypothetical protein